MSGCGNRDVLAGTSFGRRAKDRTRALRRKIRSAAFAASLLLADPILAQEAPANPPATSQPEKVQWAISLTVDGYIPPEQDDYVGPILAADHGWLHLEARYNYEDQRTGSVWIGYNFSAGKKLVLTLTPMIGGVFGRTKGIAPGCELSLSYKRIEFYFPNEFVFDTSDIHRSFYYTEPQLSYSLTDWLRVGLAAQRTKALETGFDVQRGFLVGISHHHVDFTTHVYNAGWSAPTAVLELGWNFGK